MAFMKYGTRMENREFVKIINLGILMDCLNIGTKMDRLRSVLTIKMTIEMV